eukprot:CAMPEP_0116142316 /NCGR_PEP_ID=MMETSP0329-20121206/14844_1 /TAXON_ID=697910 /ORGANISM="Pseudo-nitzschia arenysensis, Strain B593" /LENGTH=171 /DNA_ID=CAMNT_0003637545 /DNA_START=131 /DNA_END=646 /DNA_ORIENTATION=-
MTDVETSRRQRTNNRPENPYSNADGYHRYHPANLFWRFVWMGGSIYFLDRMNAYHEIMHSAHISHEWFKVGLAASIALFSLKAYVEMYTGKLQKKEVSYKSIPQITHAAILLIFVSGIAFHVALWPVYGANSMFVMFLVGAFLLNFCLMFPTIVQNVVGLGLLTFFIQEYK